MKTKLVLSTILGLALSLPAFAATHPVTGEELAANQNYTYWLLDAIKSLDPQINTDVEGSDILRSLFEGLYNEGPTGELEPGVATGYDLSDDKMTYTFHLRADANWSNGDPVTANDFVYSWRRLADPAFASEYAWYMELMQVVNAAEITAGNAAPDTLGVRAVDDHTFEVKILAPLPYFPAMTVRWLDLPGASGNGREVTATNGTLPGAIYVGNGALCAGRTHPRRKGRDGA